jgi:hypothetical protein
MNFVASYWAFMVGGLLVLTLYGHCASRTDGALPDASQMMKRVTERAEDAARAGEARKYSFEKRSIREELDASGKPTKTTEETYEVTPIQGLPFSRLIKIQNRDLTEEENEVENRKELEFRQKMAGKGYARPTRKNEDWLDPRLADRYDFQVEGRDSFQSRPVLIVSFRPKAARAPEKTIADKVLNRLAGTLLVDEQDAEVAQLKVGLTEDLSLGWFGMIGSLKRFDLLIERARLADGVWVTQKQSVVLCGRKVLGTLAYRTLEQSFNFRKP